MADKVQLELVTPSRLLLETETDMVVVPGGDGDFGVLPDHAPLLSTLRPGTLAVYEDDAVSERHFVEGGFAHVRENVLTILAERCTPLDELDREEVWEEFASARKMPADTDEAASARDRAVAVTRLKFRLVQAHRRATGQQAPAGQGELAIGD